MKEQDIEGLRAHLTGSAHDVQAQTIVDMGPFEMARCHFNAHQVGEWVPPEHTAPAIFHTWLKVASPPMNSHAFAAATREHLHNTHGLTSLVAFTSEQLFERHKELHAAIDPMSTREHWRPLGLHLFKPEAADAYAKEQDHIAARAATTEQVSSYVFPVPRPEDDGVTREMSQVRADPARPPASDDATVMLPPGDDRHGSYYTRRAEVSDSDADLTELGRAIAADLNRHWGRMTLLRTRFEDEIGKLRKEIELQGGRLDAHGKHLMEIDTEMAPLPATLDVHALSQARALLSEALSALGAISYRHTATAGWPERGTHRAETVVRTLHRLGAMLDGMADGLSEEG